MSSQQTIELLDSLLQSFTNHKIEISRNDNDQYSKNECLAPLDDALPESNDETVDNYKENNDKNLNISDSEHLLEDLLPTEIYCESTAEYSDTDHLEYSDTDHIFDDLLPSEIYGESDDENSNISNKHLMTGNAAIVTGPATININGRKVLIIYPFPCQIIQTFEDTQLGVKLAFPYDDINKKLPSVLIERDCDEVDNIEQEYLKNILCDNLGYESIKEIQSLHFQ